MLSFVMKTNSCKYVYVNDKLLRYIWGHHTFQDVRPVSFIKLQYTIRNTRGPFLLTSINFDTNMDK